MYGLPQAGIIAQEFLKERLSIIIGLWTHETRPTAFTLAVDDFEKKIMSENKADHIINASKTIVPLQWTKKHQNRLDLPLNGTMKMEKFTCPC
jgi:hypothetical protein